MTTSNGVGKRWGWGLSYSSQATPITEGSQGAEAEAREAAGRLAPPQWGSGTWELQLFPSRVTFGHNVLSQQQKVTKIPSAVPPLMLLPLSAESALGWSPTQWHSRLESHSQAPS